jgi:hypothetical protein
MATRQNTFILKRSNIPGKVPTQLELGEVALNIADVILYASGTTANSILPIGWDRVARTGDTMTGTLYVPTVSATTYFNLPTDIRVTGGTYTAGTATFRNNTGGTFTVTGFITGNTYAGYQASPADPTGTNSTTGVMMGLAGSITPSATGKVLIQITGSLRSYNIGSTGADVQIRYGTGSAPANAAALTGTAVGSKEKSRPSSTSNEQTVPFSCVARVTGLTLSTAYWLDVSVATVGGGNATVQNVSITVSEMP